MADMNSPEEVAKRLKAGMATQVAAPQTTSARLGAAALAKSDESSASWKAGNYPKSIGQSLSGAGMDVAGGVAGVLEGANSVGKYTVGGLLEGLGVSRPGPSKGQVLPAASQHAQTMNAAMARPGEAGSFDFGPKGRQPADMPGMDAAFAARGQKSSPLRQVAQSSAGITNADIAKYGPAGGSFGGDAGTDLAAYNRNLDYQRHMAQMQSDSLGSANFANEMDAMRAQKQAQMFGGKKTNAAADLALANARRQRAMDMFGGIAAIGKQSGDMTASQIKSAQDEKTNTAYQQLADQRKFDEMAASTDPISQAFVAAKRESKALGEKASYQTKDKDGASTEIAGTAGALKAMGLQPGQAAGGEDASPKARIAARVSIDNLAKEYRKSGDKSPEGRAAFKAQLLALSKAHYADPAFKKWFDDALKDFAE